MGRELLSNVDRLHTTLLGMERIKRNMNLECDDIVAWCREEITNPMAAITRKGKNWYVKTDACVITVNAGSYTIITAHGIK
ncbi:MAG: DUF3781 domain-containing protein [Anaerovibrio sp.]|nr:DUF3781 domain-containing protein [Anaerovibrio sp.]